MDENRNYTKLMGNDLEGDDLEIVEQKKENKLVSGFKWIGSHAKEIGLVALGAIGGFVTCLAVSYLGSDGDEPSEDDDVVVTVEEDGTTTTEF